MAQPDENENTGAGDTTELPETHAPALAADGARAAPPAPVATTNPTTGRLPGLAIAGIVVGGVLIAGSLFGGGVLVGVHLPNPRLLAGFSQADMPGRFIGPDHGHRAGQRVGPDRSRGLRGDMNGSDDTDGDSDDSGTGSDADTGTDSSEG